MSDTATYPEFEDIDTMPPADAAVYLLKLAKRYTDVATQAKAMAKDMLAGLGETEIITSSDGVSVHMASKTLTKVDVSALKATHPEVYEALCQAGEVTISPKALKDLNLDDVLIKSTSTYAELVR